jgi:hypothetical protein
MSLLERCTTHLLISQLCSTSDIDHLSQSSKTLFSFYASIRIAEHIVLANAIERLAPVWRKYVSVAWIRLETIEHIAKLVPNVKSLTIDGSSPYPSIKYASFHHLRELSLTSDDCFDLSDNSSLQTLSVRTLRTCVCLPPNLTSLTLRSVDSDDLATLCTLNSLRFLDVRHTVKGNLTTFPDSLEMCTLHTTENNVLTLNMQTCSLDLRNSSTQPTFRNCLVRELSIRTFQHATDHRFAWLNDVYRSCCRLTTLRLTIFVEPQCRLEFPHTLTSLAFCGNSGHLHLPCSLVKLALEQIESPTPISWSEYPKSLRSLSFHSGFLRYPPTRIPDHVQFVFLQPNAVMDFLTKPNLSSCTIQLDLLPTRMLELHVDRSCVTEIPRERARDIYRC